MITFLLQVLPERLLEGLGGAEEERLHCPLRAAERLRHVAVGEAVDPREEERRALFGRQLADRRLQLPRQLAARRALLGRDRRGVGELRALAAVVVVASRLPEVHSEATLGAADLVQAEVGRDGEEPGREAALRPVAVAEAEDLHEHVLGHFLGPGLAADQPARVLDDARAELLEEVLEGRLVPGLEAEHEGHIGIGGGPGRDALGGRRGPLVFSDRLPRPLHLTRAGRRHARADSTRRGRTFPYEGASRHAPAEHTTGRQVAPSPGPAGGFHGRREAANRETVSRSPLEPALARHLERITGYLQEAGLRQIPPERTDLRRTLADFMERRAPAVLEPWLRAIGAALGIPEADWPRIREDQAAAIGRWARHIADPADVETYVMLSRHTRQGFISRFPASRFLAAQIRFTQLLAEDIKREFAHDPAQADRLRQLLTQEFQERVLHITDFFVQAREDELRRQEAAYREELLEQEASYRRAIDGAPACILFVDAAAGTLFDINHVAERMLGYGREELRGRPFQDLHPPGERPRASALWRSALERGHASRDDLHLLTRRGELVPVFANAGYIEYGPRRWVQLICVDISDRKRLESQLIQSEKMAAIGQLAAGIAHELRNPLAIVMNALYDLHQIVDGRNAEVAEDLRIAEEEIGRAQAIIKNLLEFSRESGAELTRLDVNDLLARTLQLMQKYLQDNGVRVTTELGPIPPCLANQNAMRQIALNLITNAVQAMPEGGELRLRTAAVGPNLIRIEVRDTGVGIPAEHLQDIFNPFYTTKAPGQGTGLGLSVVHSILRRYQGEIRVASAVGVGTTFTIDLPCQCHAEVLPDRPEG